MPVKSDAYHYKNSQNSKNTQTKIKASKNKPVKFNAFHFIRKEENKICFINKLKFNRCKMNAERRAQV